jgi:two-component system, OmpR family, sensor histidine kinase SenX3
MQSLAAELLPTAKRSFGGPRRGNGPIRQPKDAALLGALTIIAHDLRGPLANLSVLIELIETYAQMQAHDRLKATTQKAQDMIEALDSMLNGFLQRTRETGDPLSFKSNLVDLADVVGDAADVNRPVAESRDITIVCKGHGISAVSGDGRLLTEAVGNLIGNAVKYAPVGSTVTCETYRSGGDAVIAITDAGQGLSELDLKRAFRPFTTLSAQYDGKGSSWGLGLWIVRLIAERHGGHVDVSANRTGQGARFELHVPIKPF